MSDYNKYLNHIPVKYIKYLGIYRYSCIIYHKKLQYVFQKNSKQIKLIYYIPQSECHLNYEILAWGGVIKTNLYPLIMFQNIFVKLILPKEIKYPSDLLYTEA